eukprot:29313-Pelagococcus_subviridis.AAC.2
MFRVLCTNPSAMPQTLYTPPTIAMSVLPRRHQRVRVLRVLVRVIRDVRPRGPQRREHRLKVVLVRHVRLQAAERDSGELVVPVRRRPSLSPSFSRRHRERIRRLRPARVGGFVTLERFQFIPPELVPEEEVVHRVRHVHLLRVERVRVRVRGDPHVSGDFLRENESGDGAPRPFHRAHALVPERFLSGHHRARLRLVRLFDLPVREEVERELRDRLQRAVAVVGRVVVLVPDGDVVAAFGVDANRGIPGDLFPRAQVEMPRAVHLGEHDAISRPFRILRHRGCLFVLLERPRVEVVHGLRVGRIFRRPRDELLVRSHEIDRARVLVVVRVPPVRVRPAIAIPLDRAERRAVASERALEDGLREVVPIQSHRVAHVHARELARQRGERHVEVDLHHVPVQASVDDHLGLPRRRRVASDLGDEEERDQQRASDGDHAPGDGALGHVTRDLAVKVHAAQLRAREEAHGGFGVGRPARRERVAK